MKKPLWIQKLEYWYEKQVARGIGSRIFMLFVATLLVVTIGTVVMYFLDSDSNVKVNAWNNVTTAINAWMPEIEEGTEEAEAVGEILQETEPEEIDWGYYIVTAFVAVGGLLITSMLIGILSSGIEEKLEDVRKGKRQLFERNHIVILGFAPGSSRILEEIIEYAAGQKLTVVIADATERVELEEEICNSVEIPQNIKIIARNVDITDAATLQCCSIPTASTVIIHPDDDGKALKSVLAVSMILKAHPESEVQVVAGVYKRKRLLPSEAIDSRIHMLRTRDTVARLMARCCVHPGLSEVLTDLFDFDGSELYVEKIPALVSKNFLEIMETMEGAVPIGIVRDENRLIIPKPGVIVREQDQLIHFAADAGSFSLTEHEKNENIELDPVKRRFGPKKKVVIIGMNNAFDTILKELPEDVHQVLFVSTRKEELEAAELVAEEDGIAISSLKGDLFDEEELLTIIADAGHIVLLASDYATGEDPDADNLALLLKLRHLRKTRNLEFSITVEFLSDSCRKMVEEGDDTDYIVASSMTSLVLSQAALNPKAVEFIREFTAHGGYVLTLKSCEAFGCTGKQRKVRELRRIAYMQNHILLGYVINQNGHVRTIINPPLEETVELTDRDSLVVIGKPQ